MSTRAQVDTSATPLARAIREVRRAAGMSQAELARAIRAHKQTISNYERGVAVPSANALFAIAIATRCDVRKLMPQAPSATAPSTSLVDAPETDIDFALRVVTVLDGLRISQARAILTLAAQVIDGLHAVDTQSERFGQFSAAIQAGEPFDL